MALRPGPKEDPKLTCSTVHLPLPPPAVPCSSSSGGLAAYQALTSSAVQASTDQATTSMPNGVLVGTSPHISIWDDSLASECDEAMWAVHPPASSSTVAPKPAGGATQQQQQEQHQHPADEEAAVAAAQLAASMYSMAIRGDASLGGNSGGGSAAAGAPAPAGTLAPGVPGSAAPPAPPVPGTAGVASHGPFGEAHPLQEVYTDPLRREAEGQHPLPPLQPPQQAPAAAVAAAEPPMTPQKEDPAQGATPAQIQTALGHSPMSRLLALQGLQVRAVTCSLRHVPNGPHPMSTGRHPAHTPPASIHLTPPSPPTQISGHPHTLLTQMTSSFLTQHPISNSQVYDYQRIYISMACRNPKKGLQCEAHAIKRFDFYTSTDMSLLQFLLAAAPAPAKRCPTVCSGHAGAWLLWMC